MATQYEQGLWIDTVLGRAEELRAAGVLLIEVDGCAATFAPLPIQPVPVGDIGKSDVVDEVVDTLHDPASYPGGVVPGFTIEKFKPIED